MSPVRLTAVAQCRQPSWSSSTRKPSGMRDVSPSAGTLQTGQGAPAPPQLQACGPSQGRSGWFSQTQPVSATGGAFHRGLEARGVSAPTGVSTQIGRGRSASSDGSQPEPTAAGTLSSYCPNRTWPGGIGFTSVPLSYIQSQPRPMRKVDAGAKLQMAAAVFQEGHELRVDPLDVDPAVLHGRRGGGDLHQLARGGFRVGEGTFIGQVQLSAPLRTSGTSWPARTYSESPAEPTRMSYARSACSRVKLAAKSLPISAGPRRSRS
ncbi:hypothetical protein FBZ94_103631 [Bradyrhizobium sacchari]|uniref:Uncharacterized protein n=1 Tax=Bradyrhizobium sacchari TaxID=1399419 RepID=A0A560IWC6_9BRAD|nr:hypothetical protein FBZ94_103631 [Bradyrhizobium sacchari]TWB76139.1 hypothetical protein FBZ95_104319 [Bradyrhizobium sacchari]